MVSSWSKLKCFHLIDNKMNVLQLNWKRGKNERYMREYIIWRLFKMRDMCENIMLSFVY